MSVSSKFDLSSGNPDKPLYASGPRGSYGAASLDRSGSSRENMENPLLSRLPNMTRSGSSVSQGDVLSFFQCVRFDPKSMVVEHKLNRPAEFKRLASAAVSIPLEDSLHASLKTKHFTSSSPEDLRRLKSGVRESGTKARERVKILNDCLSVINKCFPAISSRKRSRLDALSNDRLYTMLPADRSAAGMGIMKIGTQNQASTSVFEPEQQKCEEKTKNAVPNKRPRTSMIDSRMDVWASTPGRPSGTMDKVRDVARLSNSNVVQAEDQNLTVRVDGWDKSKMKKKRTGIKPDIAASPMMTKPVVGCNESRQGMQPQVSTEARSRYVIINGGAGMGKSEAPSGMHSSISGTDSENSSLLHERRDRPGGQEKERVNSKSVNKANSREDFSLGSPTSAKLNANVRAPRSGSVGGVSKKSQVVPRSPSSNNWELNSCTNKLTGVIGANNRKRTPSARSPSSPVANWAQRPQKISRTARRTNLLPTISGSDENPASDTTSKVMVNERHLPAHSPQLVKIRSDNFSPAALSESEESGAAEIMFREKSKMCDEIDKKNIQKLSTLLPPRKNKAVGRDDNADGVRRQGRTGRGFSSSRSLLPSTVQKLGVMGTTKQIRSARIGLDKTEGKAGRPPTRKLSDRKPYTRQKHNVINMRADFLVGSDDGHEELLAATNEVTNTALVLSSSFWKEKEIFFRYISDKDISYLKDQMNLVLPGDIPAPAPSDANNYTLLSNGCKLNGFEREESETISVEFSPEDLFPVSKSPNEINLCHRLMSALIPEEENLELFSTGKEDQYDVYECKFETEKDVEEDTFCSQVSQRYNLSGVNTNGNTFYEPRHSKRDSDVVSIQDTSVILSYEHLQNGLLTDLVMPGTACSKYQYHNMSMNERLLLELNSIGIYPDLVPVLAQSGDEEIDGDISALAEKYQKLVSKKKSLLGKPLSSSFEAKELQEKEFEGRALDKLLEMANGKYMSCWGRNTQGMKGANVKMAKQAALAFVKRSLLRCREFQVTGKSCFQEPLYKDMFLSGVLHLSDEQKLNLTTGHESAKLHCSTSGCSIEVGNSALLATQQNPLNNQELYSSEAIVSANLGCETSSGKEGSWSNRVKRRELLLDDVGGMINTSLVPSVLGGSLLCGAKGKRSERDREVKGNSGTKIGRPMSATVKGERKPKAKPKKTGHQSNAPLGNMLEQPNILSSMDKSSDEHKLEILEEPIDLSGLQLPGMGVLDVPDELSGQGEDIGSWLNIEDDGLLDHDFMGGLEIPMDDLSDLNMMV